METPKKIKKPGVEDLDVENSLRTPAPKSSKNLMDEDEFDDELDDLGDFEDLGGYDDDDDEY